MPALRVALPALALPGPPATPARAAQRQRKRRPSSGHEHIRASHHPALRASAAHDGAPTTLLSRMILAAWHKPHATHPQLPHTLRRALEGLQRAHACRARRRSATGRAPTQCKACPVGFISSLTNGLPPRLPPLLAPPSFTGTVRTHAVQRTAP